jgi:peptide/nickel transport system permease protein
VSRYALKRLLLMVPTLLGVAIIVFVLVRLIPGDPAEVMLGAFVTEERAAELRKDLGLDKPILTQFSIWLGRAMTGDFGTSIINQRPVTTEIGARFPATLELTLISTLISVLVGITLGIASAVRHKTALDLIVTIASVIGMSIPIFWLALMSLYLFGVQWGVVPISGRASLDVSLQSMTGMRILDSIIQGNWYALRDAFKHMILPAVCLAVIPLAVISRVTKASILEVLRQDYITTARGKGVGRFKLLWKHALRNALLPVLTTIGVRFGSQLAGAVLVEVVFAWPGVGRLVFESIQFRDYPMLQGCIMFIAVIFVFVNFLTDMLYSVVDPRIRYS